MVFYSDSCPHTPSSSFLAQPEFISFDMMLSEQSFKSSSLFLDRFDLFIYFAKHLAIVNSICCIGIWIFQRPYLAFLPKWIVGFLSNLISNHLLPVLFLLKIMIFFFKWDIVNYSFCRAHFFLLEVTKHLKQLSEAWFLFKGNEATTFVVSLLSNIIKMWGFAKKKKKNIKP